MEILRRMARLDVDGPGASGAEVFCGAFLQKSDRFLKIVTIIDRFRRPIRPGRSAAARPRRATPLALAWLLPSRNLLPVRRHTKLAFSEVIQKFLRTGRAGCAKEERGRFFEKIRETTSARGDVETPRVEVTEVFWRISTEQRPFSSLRNPA
jgi:hypothetical protein